jgi:biotin carboxylase
LYQLSLTTTTSLMVRSRDLATQHGLAEHQFAIGVGNGARVEDWVAIAESIDRVRPVHHVVAMNDTVMTEAATIRAALGVAGQPAPTVRAVHDKAELRRQLAEAGVETVPFALISTYDDVRAFGETHGWPVVVKPTHGAGSVGVTKVDRPSEVEDALAFARLPTVMSTGEAMVEKCLSGPLLGVDAFSEDGEHEIVMVYAEHAAHPRPYITSIVGPVPMDETWRACAEKVVRTLTALGVRNGPTHWELMFTDDGPLLIEGHLREGGDCVSDLIRAALGVDVHELWARQLLGQPVLPRLRRRLDRGRSRPRAAAVRFVGTEVGGELVAVDGLDEVRAAPGVTEVRLLVQPGSTVRPLAGSPDRCAHVIATGATPAQAMETAAAAAAGLRFVVADRGAAPSTVGAMAR